MSEKEKMENTKFVLDNLKEHLKDGGSYRFLIYDRLGFTPESGAYTELISGLDISNAFCELENLIEINKKLKSNYESMKQTSDIFLKRLNKIEKYIIKKYQDENYDEDGNIIMQDIMNIVNGRK